MINSKQFENVVNNFFQFHYGDASIRIIKNTLLPEKTVMVSPVLYDIIFEHFKKEENKSVVSDASDVHGICNEKNCKENATKDYNGNGYWVCGLHYDRLNNEFDEEYR